MFDVGFSELFVIAVVALLVLGPERLPKAARFGGLWVRRIRAHWFAVRSELENELAAEELRRSLHQAREELHATQAQLRDIADVRSDEPQAAHASLDTPALPPASVEAPSRDVSDSDALPSDTAPDRPARGP